jgi:hypothetical protein
MGKHDDHEKKTTGDGQVPKGTIILPASHTLLVGTDSP